MPVVACLVDLIVIGMFFCNRGREHLVAAMGCAYKA